MAIIIEKFSTCNKSFFDLACAIRTKVFVEEQNVPVELEYDGFDDDAVHYLLFSDGLPAVTARYRYINGSYKLERFATYLEFRRKGLSAMVLEKFLDEVRPKNKPIYLNAQVSAIGFYKKYGFEQVGDSFYDADILHYKMIYTENSK